MRSNTDKALEPKLKIWCRGTGLRAFVRALRAAPSWREESAHKLLIWAPALCLSCVTSWVSAEESIPFRMNYEVSPTPLTTAMVWTLDPEEPNPHQRRWILERKLRPVDWKVFEKAPGEWGVRLGSVEFVLKAYFRNGGAWFQTMNEFPCRVEPNSFFGTEEGTRLAARTAADFFEKQVSANLQRLVSALQKLSDVEPVLLQEKADEIFRAWSMYVDLIWREGFRSASRSAEWKSYLQESKLACSRKLKKKQVYTSQEQYREQWRLRMEPVNLESRWNQVMARTPAQRWGGRLTVRVTVDMGHHSLTGRFLIDSSAEKSMISPSFVKGMGIPSKLLPIPETKPAEISWSGGLAKGHEIHVFDTEIASVKIPFNYFTLAETRVFLSPSLRDPCCDGVLGLDFLRQNVMEIQPHDENPVVIWYDRAKGQAPVDPENWEWVETSIFSKGVLMSPCGSAGVRWNLAQPFGVVFGKSRPETVLSCPGFDFATGVVSESGPSFVLPMTHVGLNLLLRGKVIFDLARGRIWFEKAALSKPSLVESGWTKSFPWKFELTPRGARSLKIFALMSSYPELKKGYWITDIQDHPVEKIDDWDVWRLLTQQKDSPGIKIKYRPEKFEAPAELTIRRPD